MHGLPINPEALLALFMTVENAGSLAGDLEERLQRMCQRKGRILAVIADVSRPVAQSQHPNRLHNPLSSVATVPAQTA